MTADADLTGWELVVGLEVHAQLATRTKLFCGCSTRFGAPPNTQTCPVCLGLPGTLPVPSRAAFEACTRTALALRCRVELETGFERKNYYYPDLPKNYQISQDARCLGRDGHLDLPGGRHVTIDNVHLEEDAGKLIHLRDAPFLQASPLVPRGDPSGTRQGGDRTATLVDLNRAGTPLAEIVTGPDLRSTDEVREYMEALRRLLAYLEVCDGKMEEGSIRFEASISVRRDGETTLGKRVEVKNLNSTAAVLKAVEHEHRRQIAAIEAGQSVAQETRLWDDARGRTALMRSKEDAHDYRYFPEPDIVPIVITAARLDELRASLPEDPETRRRRFVATLALPDYDAGVLTAERALADYFEETVGKHGDAKEVANWVMNLLLGALHERELAIADSPVTPDALAALLKLIEAGGVAKDAARKKVFPKMLETGRPAAELVDELGLKPMDDTDAILGHVRDAIAANPKAAEDYAAGKKNAAKSLMGAVMKATRGKADPKTVGRLITEELDRSS